MDLRKTFRNTLKNVIHDFDDNSSTMAELIYEVLEEVYFQYQNEAIERFCKEIDND